MVKVKDILNSTLKLVKVILIKTKDQFEKVILPNIVNYKQEMENYL